MAVTVTGALSHYEPLIGPWRTVWAVSLSSLDLRTQGLTLARLKTSIRSFLALGMDIAHPHPLSALPLVRLVRGVTSIAFAENQLSPSLMSLSPLLTGHPRLLPQAWVQPSVAVSGKLQLAHE